MCRGGGGGVCVGGGVKRKVKIKGEETRGGFFFPNFSVFIEMTSKIS